MIFTDFTVDPLLQWPIRLCLCALFAFSALEKLRAFPLFQDSLGRYRLLPHRLLRTAAVSVLAAEALASIGMVFFVTRRGAALVMALLLVLYATAIAINLRRGRFDLDCGCQLGGAVRLISRWMVWRNLLLAILAASLYWPSGARSMQLMDWIYVLGASLAAGALYQAANILLGDIAPRVRLLGGAA